MTIDKAIELLECASHGWPAGNNEDYYKALELGIEALKRVRSQRTDLWTAKGLLELLPGETES